MKKRKLLFIIILFAGFINAQVTKTINLNSAGTLYELTTEYQATVTDLTITGNIDARDFKTMRDNMPLLSNIDLSNATILAYSGLDGTNGGTSSRTYYANKIPVNAFSFTPDGGYLQGKTSLNTIKLPNTTTEIESMAFYGCVNLQIVILNSGLKVISNDVFRSCSSLSSINLPTSLNTISGTAFRDCVGLSTLNIPTSVSTIVRDAFMGCSANITVDDENTNYSGENGVLYNKDKSILYFCPISKSEYFVVPSTVETINITSFWNCNKLSFIAIPASVTTIGDLAFYGSSGAISVEETNTNYSSKDGILYNKNKTTLIYCPNSKTGSITIPTTVTSIYGNAFHGCTSLNEIIIPNSVSNIGSQAFSDCFNLSSIYSNNETPIVLSSYSITDYTSVFYGVDGENCILYVPAGSKTAYQSANQWKDFKNIEEISTGLTPINQSDIKLFTNDRELIINNLKNGEKIEIYTISGIKTKEILTESNNTRIKLNQGIFVVRIGNYSEKIIIK